MLIALVVDRVARCFRKGKNLQKVKTCKNKLFLCSVIVPPSLSGDYIFPRQYLRQCQVDHGNGCHVNTNEALCRVNSGDAQFAFLRSGGRATWASTRINNTEEKLPRVLFDTTEMADVPAWLSVWSRRKLLQSESIGTKTGVDYSHCWNSFGCLTFSESLSCTVWNLWGFFDQKSGNHDWRCWLDALNHPLSYITHLQKVTRTDLFRGWRRLWCRVWKLCVRSRIVSFNRDVRPAHDPSWQILQQMRFTDFLICVRAWLICVFHTLKHFAPL